MRRILKRILDDLLDRGATKRPSESTWLDFLKIGLPAAFGAAGAILTPLLDLLRDYPVAQLVVRSLLPSGLAIACAYCVFAHRVETARRAGFATPPPAEVRQYRYTQVARQTSKIVFLPLMILALWSLTKLAPVSQPPMGGYICVAGSGAPVSKGEVQPLDAAGRASGDATPLDQSGFFYVEELPRNLRITSFRVTSASCRLRAPIQRDQAGVAADACRADAQHVENRVRHGGPWPVWQVHCE